MQSYLRPAKADPRPSAAYIAMPPYRQAVSSE